MLHAPRERRAGHWPPADRLRALDEPASCPFTSLDLFPGQIPTAMDRDALRFAAAAQASASPQAFRPRFAPADWHLLASCCSARRLPAGTRVVSDRGLLLVVEGRLRQGTAVLGPGAVAGAEALSADAPEAPDAWTLEDSLVLELTAARRRELATSCPAIAFELLRAAGAVAGARGRTRAALAA